MLPALGTAGEAVGPREAITAMWRHLADTRLWPSERLFFEIYGQALQGRPGTTGFLDGIVEDWIAMITQCPLLAPGVIRGCRVAGRGGCPR